MFLPAIEAGFPKSKIKLEIISDKCVLRGVLKSSGASGGLRPSPTSHLEASVTLTFQMRFVAALAAPIQASHRQDPDEAGNR